MTITITGGRYDDYSDIESSLKGKVGYSDSNYGEFSSSLSKEGLQILGLSQSIDHSDPNSYSGVVSAIRQSADTIEESPIYNYLAMGMISNSPQDLEFRRVEDEVDYVKRFLSDANDFEIADALKFGTYLAAGNLDDLSTVISKFDVSQTNKLADPDVYNLLSSSDYSELGRSTLFGNIATLVPGTGIIQASDISKEKGVLQLLGGIGYLSPTETAVRLNEADKETVIASAGAVTGLAGKAGVAIDVLLNFGDSMVPEAEAGTFSKFGKIASSVARSGRNLVEDRIASVGAWIRKSVGPDKLNQKHLDFVTSHPDAHSITRHGGAVTDSQLQRRALTGVAPDGHVKVKPDGQVVLPPMSSAFYSDELLVAADQTVRNSATFQRKVSELLPGETFITVKAGDVGDLGMDLGRGYKRIAGSRYRPDLQGPLVKVENLRSVQATYELNPQTNVWETITIFPAEL